MTTFFSKPAGDRIRSAWWAFLLLGLGWAIWTNRPKHRTSCRLKGRDVSIVIKIGDLFDVGGALVIGSNTTFDTELSVDLISERSVQGQFTRKFYDSSAHLDADIDRSLAGVPRTEIPARAHGKRFSYPIGTTASVRPKGRTAYLVAVASLNEHGVAHGTFDDIKSSLPALWEYVATRGDLQPLVMPVLGTGFSRLPQTREEIVREIVQSFVAACAAQRPCESLTIVIPIADFYDHSVDLDELERFTQHVCKYSDAPNPPVAGRGRAVE